MNIKDIRNYDPKCPICNFLRDDSAEKIFGGNYVEVAINPRWSPHLFRTALIPKRHIGERGKYGIDSLLDFEKNEYSLLRRLATNAIVRSVATTGNKLKTREGQPLVDYLERPSVHPSGDLIPQYEDAAKLDTIVLPRYLDDEIESNSSDVKKASVIVASFPKTESALTMPLLLRQKIASILKEYFVNFQSA